MTDNPARDHLHTALARIGQAVSNPTRLHLISLLSDGERTVETLAAETGTTLAATSANLKVLKAAHLVTSRRAGRNVHYRLEGESVSRFWVQLRQLGEGLLPEVRELARESAQDDVLELDGPTLLDRARRGEVLVLDLRPEADYRAGHLPAARSIPLAELERHLEALPRDRPVVAYCRGPYCVTAREAVARLRAAGLDATRLAAGLAEWRAADLPVEP